MTSTIRKTMLLCTALICFSSANEFSALGTALIALSLFGKLHWSEAE